MKPNRLLALSAALTLLTSAALADAPMTAEDMRAIWQASFDQMNTTSEPRIFTAPTEDDFAADFHSRFVALPGPNDLPYDEALQIARDAIFAQYATPADELDAMGLYPDFFAPEGEHVAEWRFYFSSLRGMDIDEDHDFPAPGEYRVYLDSPSGEVTYCGWYIDDFWPYAQRVWDAGQKDVVYGRAQMSGFQTLPADQQAAWQALLEAEGYDISGIVSGESLFHDGYFLLDLRGRGLQALPDDDPRAVAAWQAIADTFGLNTDLMRKYRYIAVNSPIAGNQTDVYIVYDGTDQWHMMFSGDVDYWCSALLGEANRLGMFLVRFDPGTGEPRYVTRGDRPTLPRDEGTPGTLLGKAQWSADDLPLFDEAYQRLEAAVTEAVRQGLRRDEQQPIANGIMRELGGQERFYPLEAETPDIGLEGGLPIATKAAAEVAGMSVEDFSSFYAATDTGYMPTLRYYEYWFTADITVTEDVYVVLVDAASGEVIHAELSHGNG